MYTVQIDWQYPIDDGIPAKSMSRWPMWSLWRYGRVVIGCVVSSASTSLCIQWAPHPRHLPGLLKTWLKMQPLPPPGSPGHAVPRPTLPLSALTPPPTPWITDSGGIPLPVVPPSPPSHFLLDAAQIPDESFLWVKCIKWVSEWATGWEEEKDGFSPQLIR